MNWIYLSPHLDDAAYSCGGLIWSQTTAGEQVSVWTICAGDPPEENLSTHAASIHDRWNFENDAVDQRRLEDIESCRILNASHRHFPIPDAIYRGDFQPKSTFEGGETEYFYQERDSLFGPLNPAEGKLVKSLSQELLKEIKRVPDSVNTNIVCPLALGNHVDHQLTRQAVERLDIPLLYYADFPYVLDGLDNLDGLRAAGWRSTSFEINQDALGAWVAAIAEYKSQLSTFWSDLDEMRCAVDSYRILMGGAIIWQPPT